MKTQTGIHRNNIGREMDEEFRFNVFRYELENGARYAQFAVALLALSAILALALYLWNR